MADPRINYPRLRITPALISANDPSEDQQVELAGIEISPGVYALAVAPYDYNPEDLAYQKGTIPYIHIDDLTVSMGDLEKLASNSYWKDVRRDYTSGNLDYEALNTVHNAGTDATTWYIWKYTWVGNNCTRTEGPLIGSVDGQDSLAWG